MRIVSYECFMENRSFPVSSGGGYYERSPDYLN